MEGGEKLGFEIAHSVVERLDNSVLHARYRVCQVFECDRAIAPVCRFHRFNCRKRGLEMRSLVLSVPWINAANLTQLESAAPTGCVESREKDETEMTGDVESLTQPDPPFRFRVIAFYGTVLQMMSDGGIESNQVVGPSGETELSVTLRAIGRTDTGTAQPIRKRL